MFFFCKANLLKSLCFIFSSLLLVSSFLTFLAPFLLVPFFMSMLLIINLSIFSRPSPFLSSPIVSLSFLLSWPSLLLFGGSTARIKRRQKRQSGGKSKGTYKEKTTCNYVINYMFCFSKICESSRDDFSHDKLYSRVDQNTTFSCFFLKITKTFVIQNQNNT